MSDYVDKEYEFSAFDGIVLGVIGGSILWAGVYLVCTWWTP